MYIEWLLSYLYHVPEYTVCRQRESILLSDTNKGVWVVETHELVDHIQVLVLSASKAQRVLCDRVLLPVCDVLRVIRWGSGDGASSDLLHHIFERVSDRPAALRAALWNLKLREWQRQGDGRDGRQVGGQLVRLQVLFQVVRAHEAAGAHTASEPLLAGVRSHVAHELVGPVRIWDEMRWLKRVIESDIRRAAAWLYYNLAFVGKQ